MTRFIPDKLTVDALARCVHDDVIKWKHFPRDWPFVRGIHRSPVNSPHKGQWRGALMFSLICAWINDWVNNREAGDLRRHRAHFDVIVMSPWLWKTADWSMSSMRQLSPAYAMYVSIVEQKCKVLSIQSDPACVRFTLPCWKQDILGKLDPVGARPSAVKVFIMWGNRTCVFHREVFKQSAT